MFNNEVIKNFVVFSPTKKKHTKSWQNNVKLSSIILKPLYMENEQHYHNSYNTYFCTIKQCQWTVMVDKV